MINDIDIALEAEVARRAAERGIETTVGPERSRTARLAARLYAGASAWQRSRILTGLLRPLGPLSIVAVASGAFAGLVERTMRGGAVTIDDIGGFSNEQVLELMRFVEQKSPEALHQVASSMADNPLGLSAFAAACATLLAGAMRGSRRRGRAGTRRPDGAAAA
jgi:hypothetical protein